jgi:S1-C subfamily serine protease
LHGHAYADSSTEELLKAVVKIRSTIPKEAESASTLGTEREGNGVVIDSEGTILTVGYLIREAERIEVIAQEGKPVRATFVGSDYNTGFGLLRTDKPLGVVPIKLGESSVVKEGDSLLVAGHGGKDSVQAAWVISRKEFAGYWEYLLDEAIYTFPAFANFSGAALITHEGKLAGIGSLFNQVQISGLGLLPCNVFIPIDLLNPILADLKNTGRSGKAQRPWLGINAEEAHGRIFITKVTSGGPADKAGLKPGDMMLMVDGKEVSGLSDFYRKLWAVGNAGVQVSLSILQGAKVRDVKVSSIDRYQRLKPKPQSYITL